MVVGNTLSALANQSQNIFMSYCAPAQRRPPQMLSFLLPKFVNLAEQRLKISVYGRCPPFRDAHSSCSPPEPALASSSAAVVTLSANACSTRACAVGCCYSSQRCGLPCRLLNSQLFHISILQPFFDVCGRLTSNVATILPRLTALP